VNNSHRLIVSIGPSQEPPATSSRRQFCAHACQAVSLVAVGALIPACGEGDSNGPDPVPDGNSPLPLLSGTISGNTVSVPTDGALAAVGSAALVSTATAAYLVARTAQTTFSVLTAVCTHEGCTVDLFNGALFVCPCHNSKYTTAGAVANGPATQALRSFPSTLTGTTLTFTV
jgi:cytochrome b6-f complex iron-sulfur subunit